MAAETLGGELGQQVLQAVLQLGIRMDRLDARMDKLEARMDKLDARMERIEFRMDKLDSQLEKIEAQVDKLNTRADRLEGWMERLGAEFIRSQTELKAAMQEGFRQVLGRAEAAHSRIDRTNDVLILVGSEVYRTMGNAEELKQRLQALESRAA